MATNYTDITVTFPNPTTDTGIPDSHLFSRFIGNDRTNPNFMTDYEYYDLPLYKSLSYLNGDPDSSPVYWSFPDIDPREYEAIEFVSCNGSIEDGDSINYCWNKDYFPIWNPKTGLPYERYHLEKKPLNDNHFCSYEFGPSAEKPGYYGTQSPKRPYYPYIKVDFRFHEKHYDRKEYELVCIFWLPWILNHERRDVANNFSEGAIFKNWYFEATFRLWKYKGIDDYIEDPGTNPDPGTEPESEPYNPDSGSNIALPSSEILDQYILRITSESSNIVTSHIVSDTPILMNPIIFANISRDNNHNIEYLGDSNPGVIIRVHTLGLVEGLKILNADTNEVLSISDDKLLQLTGSKLKAGDTIIINTNSAHKSVTLLRNGKYTNILNVLEKPFGWFKLSKGNNNLSYVTSIGADNVKFTIEYENLYEGI